MPYQLKCRCGATATAQHGQEDPSTNSCEVDTDDVEWTGGDATCSHEEYEIVGYEYPEPLEGDADIPPRDPDRPLGTPISELSGRPGHPGYEEFCRIARSWGYD